MNKQSLKNQFLNIYKQFNKKLELLDVNDLKDFTREELKELVSEIHDISSKSRSVTSEILALEKEMKLAEIPALLGVYRFPILNEIDFLEQDVKVALDKNLAKFYKGNRLAYLPDELPSQLVEKTLQWLIAHDVILKEYKIECDCGDDDAFYEVILQEEFNEDKEKYLHVRQVVANSSAFPEEESWDAEMELDRLHRCYTCEECDDNLAYRLFVFEPHSSLKEPVYTMNMSPDFSLEKK